MCALYQLVRGLSVACYGMWGTGIAYDATQNHRTEAVRVWVIGHYDQEHRRGPRDPAGIRFPVFDFGVYIPYVCGAGEGAFVDWFCGGLQYQVREAVLSAVSARDATVLTWGTVRQYWLRRICYAP
eukprot:128538-Rhodomonas_salina.4